jgi:DNA polymerase-1
MRTKSKLPQIEKRAQAFFPRRRHEQGAPLLLIVDGNNIAYQAYYAYKTLKYMGRPTSILFGFPKILQTILLSYKAHKVIVCWDGEKDPRRMKKLSSYKSHREENRDPKVRKRFIKQMERTRKLLNYLGIAQCYNPKIEGDDMIYWVWKKYSPLYRVVIATADKDLHQLINYDTTVYNPRTKAPFSNFAYVCDNLVEPYQYVDYLCLVGDSSDDIPGYRGIGPTRAAAFFTAFRGIKEYLNSNKEVAGLNDKDKLREVWLRNRFMMDLKYFNEKYHSDKVMTFYKDRRNPTFNEQAYKAYCLRFGMKTLVFESFYQRFKEIANA